MRKYILLLILSCFHVLSRGQTPVEIDLSGVPEPTHAESIRYWFDDDAGSLSTSTLLNGSYTLDASSLLDGLHTIHYQIVDSKGMVTSPSTAIFMKMGEAVVDVQGTAAQLSYWFDDQSSVTTTSTVNGVMTLDASSLLDGLHTIHYQIVDSKGMVTSPSTAIFMKMSEAVVDVQGTAAQLSYWFDEQSSVTTTSTVNGIMTLDASSLLDGLHTIHYQIVDSKGMVTSPSTAIFMKMSEAVVDEQGTAAQLSYWFDDQSSVTTTSTVNGVMTLDASSLLDGLHTIHYQITDANGVKGYIASSIFMKMNNMMVNNGEPVTAKELMYWFDDETEQRNMDMSTGIQMLDASHLLDGLHTLHYQVICSDGTITSAYSAIFMRMNVEIDNSAVAAKSLRYWFDDSNDVNTAEMLSGTYMLDASSLLDGLHTIHYQVVDVKGAAGNIASSIFMKMEMMSVKEATSAKKQRYWFDDDKSTLIETDIADGTQMLDASQLLMGLHTVHYQLVDENGDVSAPYTALFMKMDNSEMADGKNAITGYMYWLNDNSQNNKKVKVDNADNPYQLITLLPMIKTPIRSSSFQFEVKDGVPMIYAKNDLHVRFEDAKGYWADDARSFVDYNVSEVVNNVSELQSTQTFTRTDNNEIKWFQLEATPGDTIAIRASQATSLQVFAPSGKKIYAASGDKSVAYGGAHTWEDGTYYVAVHDVTGSRPNITLDYMHMDKYDVVDQDVRVVGNGGCSTITFQGNGFRSLYAVDLYTAQGDTIHSLDVGHESDAETSVTFDFTGAELGKYNAVFHFTEEDKFLANNITVEEAKEIELATRVSYPSTFLRGTSVTYTVEITNKGNMTAYYVPTYIYLKNKERNGISCVEIKGLDLPALTEGLDTEVLPESSVSYFKRIVDQYKDDLRFIKGWQVDPDTGDTISVRVCDAYICIKPQMTLTFSVNIKSTDDVYLNVSVPREWKAISADIQKKDGLHKVSGNDMIQQYCCYKERIECVLDVASIACDVVSPIIGFIGNFVPEAKVGAVAVALAGCNISIEGDRLKAFGESLCNSNEESALKKMLIAAYKARTTMPSLGSVLSCVGGVLGALGLPEGKMAEALNMLSNSLSAGALFNDNINLWGAQTSCSAIGQPKPNCPPNPGGGGGSSIPVNSLDPNDIYGYVAQSGSKFIGEDVVTLLYRIEFENDTTFATASAHTVIVKDTLDATKFDLASYQPTSITIGDNSVQLKGDKEFVTTVDMRPAINAIAQVEGKYDEEKGIATWQFTSLDPMTMEPTDDVMQGFLPVNFDGRGIGEVAFNINRKAGLADGTEIPNRASITFDTNDPILTPTWTNTIDAIPPVSRVTNAVLKNDSTATIFFEGGDARSGVWKYDVYAQLGEGTAWQKVAECGADSVYVDYPIFKGIDYGFCVLATDSAGNVEHKEMVREAVVVNVLKGDANSDGVVNIADAVLIVNKYLGTPNTYLNALAADANDDGVINVQDAIAITNMYLNSSAPRKSRKVRRTLTVKN